MVKQVGEGRAGEYARAAEPAMRYTDMPTGNFITDTICAVASRWPMVRTLPRDWVWPALGASAQLAGAAVPPKAVGKVMAVNGLDIVLAIGLALGLRVLS